MTDVSPLSDEGSECEIVTARLINASREAVFNAWTDPELLPKWYGPDGFRVTIQEIDVKPGGEWRFVMHGPDGTDYNNHIVYDQIVAPARIEYTHVSDPGFKSVATIDEEGDKALVTLRMIFDSKELRDQAADEYGALEGANQTLGRLDDLLAALEN